MNWSMWSDRWKACSTAVVAWADAVVVTHLHTDHLDETAAGLIGEAQRMGLRLPDDLAVTGFDDTAIADELVRLSMLAGYDPVSGFFGIYSETENTFELAGR